MRAGVVTTPPPTMDVPPEARAAARVLLIDADRRVLLMEAKHADTGNIFWLAPGGGLADGETFEQAAARELWEETGIRAAPGPCVWLRRHRYMWAGRMHDQYERYFIARTEVTQVKPQARDSYVIGHRWWTPGEIAVAKARFTPQKLPVLLPALLEGVCPASPIDCGA